MFGNVVCDATERGPDLAPETLGDLGLGLRVAPLCVHFYFFVKKVS